MTGLAENIRNGLTLPVICAPMFLVSTAVLAIECCKAGVIGSLTRNHCRSTEEFGAQLFAVRDALSAFRQRNPARIIGPLAANLSLRLDKDDTRKNLELCRDAGVAVILSAVGDPAPLTAAAHDMGMLVFHDATSIRFAEKAIAAGVDGIVAIGAGGGGHSGMISHLTLIPQIREMFGGTIVMAGAVANGAAIRAAEVLGADLAYIGTRFISTKESGAPQEYKELLVSQKPADLLYTPAINGVPANWLKESMRRVGLDPANLPMSAGYGTGRGHLPAGVKPWVSLWSAGQGIGLIHDIPSVADLVERLHAEYSGACTIPNRYAIPGAHGSDHT